MSPRRRSARCWSSGRRTRPWRPVRRMRPSSRTYLSSSETSRSEPRRCCRRRRRRGGTRSLRRPGRIRHACERRSTSQLSPSLVPRLGNPTYHWWQTESNQRDCVSSRYIGYKVKDHDHCHPSRTAHRPPDGRRRPRADRRPPGQGDGASLHRRGALDGAGPGAGRHAPEALPGRPARGARGRDGARPHDDAEGVRRRPRPRRRQGGDDRRRPAGAARGAARGARRA